MRVEGAGLRVEGVGLRAEGGGLSVEGVGLRVEGVRPEKGRRSFAHIPDPARVIVAPCIPVNKNFTERWSTSSYFRLISFCTTQL